MTGPTRDPVCRTLCHLRDGLGRLWCPKCRLWWHPGAGVLENYSPKVNP